MSIPKSISLFLASVLVAIPTALTGIHLAKPKPLVHMNDELIELEEREEITEPEEIKPQSAPEPKPEGNSGSSPSVSALPSMPAGSQPQSEGSQGEEQQQILSEGEDQEEVEEEGSNPPEEEQPPEQEPEVSPETQEDTETEGKNDEQGDKEEKKEPKEQELKDFLIQLIPLLIESSKKYKSGDSSLFDTYSVMSGLADLNSTLESYKQLQEKAKAEAAQQEKK